MTETRERIAARVREAPGVHFRGLVRDLDLAPGQVQYHLRRLGANDRVSSATVRGRTHYFPPEADATRRRAVALLRRETARDAVALLANQGPIPPGALADELGVARSSL